jgi:c-di-GMP phosphodiesterase
VNAPDLQIKDLFLARQPIVTADGNLYGFELFFRAAHVDAAEYEDDVEATASVVANVLGELGVERTLGQFLGFVNVTALFVQTDLVEILDPERIVLEMPASTRAAAPLVKRCADLAARGFVFALDGCQGDLAGVTALLPYVKYVKFNSAKIEPERVATLAKALQARKIHLVAERIETGEAFSRFKGAGCELFQGYHFAAPELITGRRAAPAKAAMLRLLALVSRDAEISEIEQALKQQPNLGYNLLRLVNSAACGLKQKIGSLKQALVMLGRRQLQMWLQLLLYAGESANRQGQSPLLQTAAMRGRTMELVAHRLQADSRDLQERAFMTGMLSLMDVLLGVTREALLDELHVAEDVRAALLNGEGVLGDLLTLAAALERDDRESIGTVLAGRTGLEVRALFEDQLAAFQWANSLFEEVGSSRAGRRA